MARNSSEFYKGDHAFAIRTFLRRIIDLPKLIRPALYNTTLLLARFTENLNLQRGKELSSLLHWTQGSKTVAHRKKNNPKL